MYLTRHMTPDGTRWARDGHWLPAQLRLGLLLALSKPALAQTLASLPAGAPATGPLLAPLEPLHEVWGAGVTYQRSREARQAESDSGDIYDRVYAAERPEFFFKSIGWRVVGPGGAVRVRADSRWNVPEPEMALVINAHGEIVGYTASNDLSSRSIEGENPLYLPQAKIFTGACALGPGLELLATEGWNALPIGLQIERGGQTSPMPPSSLPSTTIRRSVCSTPIAGISPRCFCGATTRWKDSHRLARYWGYFKIGNAQSANVGFARGTLSSSTRMASPKRSTRRKRNSGNSGWSRPCDDIVNCLLRPFLNQL